MITLVEALNFRSLRYVARPLDRFHVLVGPNASGKTTFLDVIGLLGDLVSKGLEAAVESRTPTFQDLLWRRSGASFELAIEGRVPEEHRVVLEHRALDTIRYEVSLGSHPTGGEVAILAERVLLRNGRPLPKREATLFPTEPEVPPTILTPKGVRGAKTIVNKLLDGNDNFYDETGKGWDHAFRLGPRKSALANLPEDESKFPVSTWLKRMLAEGVQSFVLNSLLIRKASPPGLPRRFKPDGSNLPWVVQTLIDRGDGLVADWIAHVRTALPDLDGVRTVERPDDKHRYLVLRYRNGIEVPSWMASDGTLRLLALTLPAYLPDFRGIYLIEEPENGIHPKAVEAMFQSLSSTYDAQVLLATHSPVILSVADVRQLLCFAKTPEGVTDIVPGHEHPRLKEWRGETTLGVLFASGVLG